jgi:hypothetical protein
LCMPSTAGRNLLPSKTSNTQPNGSSVTTQFMAPPCGTLHHRGPSHASTRLPSEDHTSRVLNFWTFFKKK